MCEVTLPDELNTFFPCFDLLNKESAVKSTLPPKDQPLSVSTVNVSEAAEPDNAPDRVLRTCANQLVDVITDIFHYHRRVFPPASRQPPSSPYLQ